MYLLGDSFLRGGDLLYLLGEKLLSGRRYRGCITNPINVMLVERLLFGDFLVDLEVDGLVVDLVVDDLLAELLNW